MKKISTAKFRCHLNDRIRAVAGDAAAIPLISGNFNIAFIAKIDSPTVGIRRGK